MATIRMTANVALEAKIKYLDLVPGEFGSQARFKGTFDGEEGVIYSPGKIVEVLNTLLAAGIITSIPSDLAPEKPVDLKPKRKEFQMILDQPAGQKYGVLRIVGAPAAAAGASPPAAPAAANGNGHAPAATNGQRSLQEYYKSSAKFVIEQVVPLFQPTGIGLSDTAVAAMINTLFIAKSKE